MNNIDKQIQESITEVKETTDYETRSKFALRDANIISKTNAELMEVITKLDLMKKLKDPTPEQAEETKLLEDAFFERLKDFPVDILAPMLVNRDDDRKDIIIVTSSSLIFLVSEVLSSDLQVSIPGYIELIKNRTNIYDAYDFIEGISLYISKVALFQMKNPIVVDGIPDPNKIIQAHSAGGKLIGEGQHAFNLNAISAAINAGISALIAMKCNPGMITVIDDICGVPLSMDYTSFDFINEAKVK